MSTTKRKREDDAEELGPSKKLKIGDKASGFTVECLPEEIWIQILTKITLNKIGPIRQVCCQLNKLTRTMDYAKGMCIKKFGSNILPLQIRDLSSLSEVADSELAFIPTTQQDSKLIVDWFEYYKLRALLKKFLRKLQSTEYELVDKTLLPRDPDVSCTSVKQLLDIHYFDDIPRDILVYLNSLLLKLIPLFVQYKRIELAKRVIDSLINPEALEYYIDLTDLTTFLDLHDIVSFHFPERSNEVFQHIIKATERYSGIEAVKEHFHQEIIEPTYRRLVKLIIQYGSKQDSHQNDIDCILNDETDDRDFFDIILDTPNVRTFKLMSAIVPTCREEFDKTDDWRVKESSLLTPHISADFMKEYSLACVEFAFHALRNNQLHPNVHCAAILLLYKSEIDLSWLSNEQFDELLKHLTTALTELEPTFIWDLMKRLAELFEFAVESPSGLTVAQLDLFHTHLFKALLTPGVINNDDHESLEEALLSCTGALGERAEKYLPQYREVLFKLASDGELRGPDLTPAKLLSIYIDTNYFVGTSYIDEQNEILKQVEEGTIGFPVDVTEFHSLRPLETLAAPHTNKRKFIESLLGNFPIEARQFIENTNTEEENTTVVPLPDYIPFTQQQWNEALEWLPNTDPNDFPSLFNFTSYSGQQEQISKVDLTNLNTNIAPLLRTSQKLVGSLTEVISYLKDNDENEILRDYSVQILSIIVCTMYVNTFIPEKWLNGTVILLQEISANLPQEKLSNYMVAVLGAFKDNTVVDDSFNGPFEELQECILELILALADPNPELLRGFLNLRFRHAVIKRYIDMNFTEILASLEIIISKWPRAALIAISKSRIVTRLDSFSNDEKVSRIMIWQLLAKHYGFKFLTDLFRKNKPALAYYHEEVKACLDRLDQFTHTELQSMAQAVLPKFAILCRLYYIDKTVGDLCMYNQFIIDQSNIGELLTLTNPEVVSPELAGNYFSVFF